MGNKDLVCCIIFAVIVWPFSGRVCWLSYTVSQCLTPYHVTDLLFLVIGFIIKSVIYCHIATAWSLISCSQSVVRINVLGVVFELHAIVNNMHAYNNE